MYRMMWGYFFPEEKKESQRRQVNLEFQCAHWLISTTMIKFIDIMCLSKNYDCSYRRFGRFRRQLVQGVWKKVHRSMKLLLQVQRKSLKPHPNPPSLQCYFPQAISLLLKLILSKWVHSLVYGFQVIILREMQVTHSLTLFIGWNLILANK